MFSSISTFLSRRYNLSNSLSDRDRESLAQDVAYSLKHIPATSSQQSQQQEEQQTTADISVEDGNDDLERALEELETVLSACELSLQQFEKKERFLYVRIGRYREMIEGQACYIEKLEQDEQEQQEQVVDSDTNEIAAAISEDKDDEEDNKHAVDMENDNNAIKNSKEQEQKISKVKKKHTQDEQKLQEVENIHASIITQIELLKRRIGELEDKKQDILEKREDCHQFLMQVAEKGI